MDHLVQPQKIKKVFVACFLVSKFRFSYFWSFRQAKFKLLGLLQPQAPSLGIPLTIQKMLKIWTLLCIPNQSRILNLSAKFKKSNCCSNQQCWKPKEQDCLQSPRKVLQIGSMLSQSRRLAYI